MAKTPQIKLSKAGRTRGADYVDAAPVPRSERRGPGRPSKYDEAVMLATACECARKGYTSPEIAEELGIGLSTLYRYFADTPQFREAVKAAKDVIDDRVQASLLQRATGYRQRVEKVFANGVRLQVIEEVQPDTTAQIFWLKNRRRAEFRDTREVDLVVPDTGPQTEDLDTRALALAAINLLHDATDDPDVGRTTLDLEPNSTEEVDDDETDEASTVQERVEAGPDRQARSRGRRNQAEDFDPDFDL